jgi:hypothetical protein
MHSPVSRRKPTGVHLLGSLCAERLDERKQCGSAECGEKILDWASASGAFGSDPQAVTVPDSLFA